VDLKLLQYNCHDKVFYKLYIKLFIAIVINVTQNGICKILDYHDFLMMDIYKL